MNAKPRLQSVPMGQDKVVPHEAEGDQLDLGKGALLGEQLPEHLLGAVIENHAPLDHAGHGVDHGDGGVGGTEEAERAHGESCSREQTPQCVRVCKWNLQASDGPKIRKT